jgi:predicted dehydrogenase
MRRLQLIQAGMGGMGRAWWRQVVPQSPDFHLAAIVDIAEPPLHEAGDALQIPADRRFRCLAAALEAVPADAVLTVTPPAVHAEHAELAFSRGLHLLTEKPIATDLTQARRMVAMADAATRQLVVAQNYRYSAVIQRLKELIDSHPLGDFGHGHIDFYIPADFAGTFRQTMPHPLLVDMAIHHLDLIRYLTGRNILSVIADSYRPSWSWYEGESALKMLLRLDGGAAFSYSGDWSAKGAATSWNGNWRLQFAEGAIYLENDRIQISRSDRWMNNPSVENVEIDSPPINGQAALLERFAAAIRSGKPAETSGADNLWSFAAVIAGTISTAEASRRVEVASLLQA